MDRERAGRLSGNAGPAQGNSAGRAIFLTGATGFIGARVAQLLAARGEALRCLVRRPDAASELKALGAALIEGDTTDAAALARGMEGCNRAIHLAAVYDVGVVDEDMMQRVNVDGTRNFLDAARRAHLERAIHVSTTVALGPVRDGRGDETTTHDGHARSVYERTKVDAHRAAHEAQKSGEPVIIVCPAYVYGPGDTGPGGRFLHDLLRKRVPGLLTHPSWFSFVHVDDVAAGIVAALDAGRPGATYVLSGDDATINDFAKRAATLAGTSAPILRFPPFLARMTGIALDAVTRVTGMRFPITRENVDTAGGQRWLHSHAAATRDLGYAPRSLAEGLPETVAWMKRKISEPAGRSTSI